MSDFMLATCSYNEFKEGMGQPVQTSLGYPKWWGGGVPRVAEVTPKGWYLRKTPAEFKKAYWDQLDRFGSDYLQQIFQEVADETGADLLVLLCFEKLTKSWCHRTLFRQWWTDKTGMEVPELGATAVSLPPEPPTLF